MVIYVWPDGSWCDADEMERCEWKSDDCEKLALTAEWETYCQNDGNYYSYDLDLGVMVRSPDSKIQVQA